MRTQAGDSFRVLILVILSMLTLFIFLNSAIKITKPYNKERLAPTVLERLNASPGSSKLKKEISYKSKPETKQQIVKKDYYFRVLLCIYKGTNEKDIEYLLNKAVSYLHGLGVGIKLKIENVEIFDTKKCPCKAGSYDMAVCYGPYFGSGYIGEPYYVLLVNSTGKLDNRAIYAVANTIMYYLGVEPLYCYHIGKKTFYFDLIKNNLQYTISVPHPELLKIQDYIATYNLYLARKYGKGAIEYPKERLVGYKLILETNSKNTNCYVYTIKCSNEKEVGVVEKNPFEVSSDDQGTITFTDSLGTPVGFKIVCNDKTYWLFSLELDKCFFYSKNEECKFDCKKSNLCAYV